MSKTKIPWCDETRNFVWGCHNGCEYCYARGIAKRFGRTEEERNFSPTLRPNAFDKPYAKSTKRVFLNSMSDIAYWQPAWMQLVIEHIRQHPHIQFIILTKINFFYECSYWKELEHPNNLVCGITYPQFCNSYAPYEDSFVTPNLLINFEPIMDTLATTESLVPLHAKWVIFGAMTGRFAKVYPVDGKVLANTINLLKARRYPPAIFVKPSLKGIVPDEIYLQEYPIIGGK